jgi:hypothetical protein
VSDDKWAAYRELLATNTANWPEWREGQGCYNTLYEIDPELARSFHGTELDPYYFDERVPAFHARVREAWNV